MSHAKNKVNWCLRKAEREIKEGKKHRGLIEKEKDTEESRKHILKAEHNLNAISYFNEGNFSDWSMSAVFYCIYHCFLAIALKFGYESRNQECTIALIKYLKEQGKIDINENFIEALDIYDEKERHESSIIEKREAYTYGTTTSADNKEEIDKAIDLCKDCLDKTKEIVFS
ncbi:MAG TPA: HEPN domain-containing protein [Candidatus Paceibacterota bacterium]|nr:HEPN domain-containing protein [Candidatus Paceibacterota bacterium]